MKCVERGALGGGFTEGVLRDRMMLERVCMMNGRIVTEGEPAMGANFVRSSGVEFALEIAEVDEATFAAPRTSSRAGPEGPLLRGHSCKTTHVSQITNPRIQGWVHTWTIKYHQQSV